MCERHLRNEVRGKDGLPLGKAAGILRIRNDVSRPISAKIAGAVSRFAQSAESNFARLCASRGMCSPARARAKRSARPVCIWSTAQDIVRRYVRVAAALRDMRCELGGRWFSRAAWVSDVQRGSRLGGSLALPDEHPHVPTQLDSNVRSFTTTARFLCVFAQ